ncbi:uncharacterized protein I206_101002 [Kwoniella pini CBS 10737]|uniref:Uncharacterized protein n=1 Tax=Kwoniella pini CBS 10737 TaxID=1296096 RepID=A0A1B9IC38_9TREE|nr:uncharacterized protein I206_00324 [Kwoniella pini CBS 10737]OCF53023.1 hypothetical protein I206_00324 [Kwoniella pini CBS 10737]
MTIKRQRTDGDHLYVGRIDVPPSDTGTQMEQSTDQRSAEEGGQSAEISNVSKITEKPSSFGFNATLTKLEPTFQTEEVCLLDGIPDLGLKVSKESYQIATRLHEPGDFQGTPHLVAHDGPQSTIWRRTKVAPDPSKRDTWEAYPTSFSIEKKW